MDKESDATQGSGRQLQRPLAETFVVHKRLGATMNQRDAILARLRQGLQRPGPLFRDGLRQAETPSTPTPLTGEANDPATFPSGFLNQLQRAGGEGVFLESTQEVEKEVCRIIDMWLHNSDDRRIMGWDPKTFGNIDVERILKKHNITIVVPEDLQDTDERNTLAELSVGITGVTAAFAGTGSVALVPAPGISRSASLLPLYHLMLVPRTSIFANAESWIAELDSKGELQQTFVDCSQVVFVTGPSKSADIELNLTTGVHGPKVVHAIVYDDQQ